MFSLKDLINIGKKISELLMSFIGYNGDLITLTPSLLGRNAVRPREDAGVFDGSCSGITRKAQGV